MHDQQEPNYICSLAIDIMRHISYLAVYKDARVRGDETRIEQAEATAAVAAARVCLLPNILCNSARYKEIHILHTCYSCYASLASWFEHGLV